MSHAKKTGLPEERRSTGAGSVPLENGVESYQHDSEASLSTMVGLPAYNEEVGIGSVILAARAFADEIVVVDDGSTDQTVEVARAAGAIVIEHETNTGKGGAVKTLFEMARERSPEVLVLLDADGQHVPSDIPHVARPVLEGDADISIGSRYIDPKKKTETPLYRRFGQRVLDILTTGSSGQNLTDTQSGFRAFSAEAVEQLTLTTDGIGVETEMIRDATEKGLEMVEVPIDVRYEGIDGQTYNPVHHGLTVVSFVLALIRDRHPLLFFTVPGSIILFVGALYGIDSILAYQTTAEFYPTRILMSGFMSIIGTLAVFTGITLHTIGYQLEELKNS